MLNEILCRTALFYGLPKYITVDRQDLQSGEGSDGHPQAEIEMAQRTNYEYLEVSEHMDRRRLLGLSRVFPRVIPFTYGVVQNLHFHPRRRVDRSDRVIKLSSSIPIHQETEYAIPREQAAKAVDETRKLVLKAPYRVNFPLEVRFVAADDIPMSPASGRDSCYVGAYVSSRKWAPSYFAEFEEMVSDYAGRPHWGKSFSRTHEELRKLYPAYDDFDRLRRRCDPNGVFRNSFVDRVFPARSTS